MEWASLVLAWFMSLFGIGSSIVAQHNAMKMQQQQMVQQQTLMQQQAREQAEQRANMLHCPWNQEGTVIDNHDGTYSARCRPITK
jgi:hypothetical protein